MQSDRYYKLGEIVARAALNYPLDTYYSGSKINDLQLNDFDNESFINGFVDVLSKEHKYTIRTAFDNLQADILNRGESDTAIKLREKIQTLQILVEKRVEKRKSALKQTNTGQSALLPEEASRTASSSPITPAATSEGPSESTQTPPVKLTAAGRLRLRREKEMKEAMEKLGDIPEEPLPGYGNIDWGDKPVFTVAAANIEHAEMKKIGPIIKPKPDTTFTKIQNDITRSVALNNERLTDEFKAQLKGATKEQIIAYLKDKGFETEIHYLTENYDQQLIQLLDDYLISFREMNKHLNFGENFVNIFILNGKLHCDVEFQKVPIAIFDTYGNKINIAYIEGPIKLSFEKSDDGFMHLSNISSTNSSFIEFLAHPDENNFKNMITLSQKIPENERDAYKQELADGYFKIYRKKIAIEEVKTAADGALNLFTSQMEALQTLNITDEMKVKLQKKYELYLDTIEAELKTFSERDHEAHIDIDRLKSECMDHIRKKQNEFALEYEKINQFSSYSTQPNDLGSAIRKATHAGLVIMNLSQDDSYHLSEDLKKGLKAEHNAYIRNIVELTSRYTHSVKTSENMQLCAKLIGEAQATFTNNTKELLTENYGENTFSRNPIKTGAIGGAAAGAITGALLGTFIFPILGSAVGAAIGALLGGLVGAIGGGIKSIFRTREVSKTVDKSILRASKSKVQRSKGMLPLQIPGHTPTIVKALNPEPRQPHTPPNEHNSELLNQIRSPVMSDSPGAGVGHPETFRVPHTSTDVKPKSTQPPILPVAHKAQEESGDLPISPPKTPKSPR